MVDESKLYFHESTVIQFEKISDKIVLRAKNVSYGDEFKEVALELSGVSRIETDAIIKSDNLMPADDGEIVCLDIKDNKMTLVVEWNDYENERYFKYGYEIFFDDYKISIK